MLMLAALLLAVGPVAGQEEGRSIVGEVVEGGAGGGVSAVEVSLRSIARDSAVVATSLTDGSGRFVFSAVSPGDYAVVLRRLGYETQTRGVEVAPGSGAVDLGTVPLMASAVALEGVSVVAEQPEVVQTADRDIYRADAIPGAAGGSATDLLEGVPDLEVDINGQVSLHGQAPAIYINGREAPMDGESLALFLEQFAAENVQSIEVIPNPSARYNADGAGGIINIVLKEDVGLGLSGNAFVNGGTRGQYGGGGRVTYERGPLRLNGGGSLRLSSDESTSRELRQNLITDPVTFLEQDGWSDRSRHGGNMNLRADYELSQATQLEADVRLRRNVSSSSGAMRYTEMDSEQNPTDAWDRLTSDDGIGSSVSLALELEHEFGVEDGEETQREFWERGDELNVEIEFQRDRDGDRSEVERRFLEEVGAIDYATELTWEDERETESEVELGIDYARSLGDALDVEIGYEAEFGWTDDERLQETRLSGEQVPSLLERRSFVHRQRVHGGYLTLTRTFGDLSAQLGVRGEHAGNWLELPGHEETYGGSRFDLFPSANLNYSFGGGKRIRASYSMRVRRPSSGVLNPINTSSDPLHIRIGNPDIEPQFTHSYTLNASWSGRLGDLRATPFIRRSVNQWEQLRTVDEDGVATTTYANLGSTGSYGVTLTGSLRDLYGFDARATLNGQHTRRDYAAVLDRATPASTRWSLRGNLDRDFGGGFRVQSSVVYNPPRDLPQGRASSTTMTRLGMRYRFLDRRASLSLNVTDPLDIYNSSVQRSTSSYIEIGRERVSMRRLTLSLSYSFQGEAGGGRGRGGGGPRR